MGNIILSNDFVSLSTITSRTEATGYADDNVGEHWHLKRRFRANDVTANDWLLKFNFGAAKTVVGVFLNDVNFDKVKIQGHATDAWGTPSYDGSEITISRDAIVDRYKVYIPITGFNLQWMRIFIPSGASAVGDYTTKWEVGTIIVLDSITALAKNMAYGYERTAKKAFTDIKLPHGGFERVNLGDAPRWEGKLIFGMRDDDDESELWTINNYNIGDPLLFYENDTSTSRVYLCLRDDAYRGTSKSHDVVMGNVIRLKELI